MALVTPPELLDSGVHFGHQTRRWNPKMRRFILGERNGIYLIDLHKTLAGIEAGYAYVRDLVASGGIVLFVGTKKQTQGPIADYAEACSMPFVNQRWLGGMLTNFQTVARARQAHAGAAQHAARRRLRGHAQARGAAHTSASSRSSSATSAGIAGLDRLPDAIFVIDTKKEHIAVTEANKLGLPVVAVVDTNCDPDVIDYVIPGNDDAIRAGALLCRVIADAVVEGRWIREPTRPHERRRAAPLRSERDPRRRAPADGVRAIESAEPEELTCQRRRAIHRRRTWRRRACDQALAAWAR